MAKIASNPEKLTQNLPEEVALAQASLPKRIRIYRGVVERAWQDLIWGCLNLRVPRLVGLRRRGGPAFHATPELFFQQCGSTIFEMPEETFTVGPGELCLMPTGMPHAETACAGPAGYLTLITMFWPDGFSVHFGHTSPEQRVRSDPHDRFTLSSNLFQQCLQEIAAVSARPVAGRDRFVDGLLAASLGTMLHAFDLPQRKSEAGLDLVARCRTLVEQHLHHRDLSVTWLAAHLGCTPDHLSRAFQAKTGVNLIDSINRARISSAVRLMSRLDFNIAEIAWASGYATQSYFNRLFLRQMGQTPRQYRASIAVRGLAGSGGDGRLAS
jgi:AraC-like DNA-binding protein